jgi:hypothetical protein
MCTHMYHLLHNGWFHLFYNTRISPGCWSGWAWYCVAFSLWSECFLSPGSCVKTTHMWHVNQSHRARPQPKDWNPGCHGPLVFEVNVSKVCASAGRGSSHAQKQQAAVPATSPRSWPTCRRPPGSLEGAGTTRRSCSWAAGPWTAPERRKFRRGLPEVDVVNQFRP